MAGLEKPEKMGRKKTRIEGVKQFVVSVKGTEAWHAWVNRFAKFRRIDATVLVELSLIEAAKAHGFDEPPPERMS